MYTTYEGGLVEQPSVQEGSRYGFGAGEVRGATAGLGAGPGEGAALHGLVGEAVHRAGLSG